VTLPDWKPRLDELCAELRVRTRGALTEALESNDRELSRPQGRGAGDFTYGLDLPSEAFLRGWQEARAREGPLSILTEDMGWRHLGPAPGGGVRELDSFDHGGPRIVFDPVDGTRNLMSNLRSAWTVVSFAPPGPGMPQLSELTCGMLAEIPTTHARDFRVFSSDGETTWLEEGTLTGDVRTELASVGRSREVHTDDDDRPDHGYFPFFRYDPLERLHLAEWEHRFFQRLQELESAELHSVYNDQYCSTGGQLVELMLGNYRMSVDARGLAVRRTGRDQTVAKPYDIGGGILCARAAGCELSDAEGGELDFPMDVETPVDYCGYVNAKTRARLEPHWLAAIAPGSPAPGER